MTRTAPNTVLGVETLELRDPPSATLVRTPFALPTGTLHPPSPPLTAFPWLPLITRATCSTTPSPTRTGGRSPSGERHRPKLTRRRPASESLPPVRTAPTPR